MVLRFAGKGMAETSSTDITVGMTIAHTGAGSPTGSLFIALLAVLYALNDAAEPLEHGPCRLKIAGRPFRSMPGQRTSAFRAAAVQARVCAQKKGAAHGGPPIKH